MATRAENLETCDQCTFRGGIREVTKDGGILLSNHFFCPMCGRHTAILLNTDSVTEAIQNALVVDEATTNDNFDYDEVDEPGRGAYNLVTKQHSVLYDREVHGPRKDVGLHGEVVVGGDGILGAWAPNRDVYKDAQKHKIDVRLDTESSYMTVVEANDIIFLFGDQTRVPNFELGFENDQNSSPQN